ncbi:MAG: DNA ligase D [Gammaproteobacteria bacterium]
MRLTSYNKKRNFNKTTEPKGEISVSTKNQLYVIQKHAASHLHYDFRLEIAGVLKSWAVPKGPCLDPDVKRLAVQVEDHPLEYGHFEGIIPQGEYGGGTVMIWDIGFWQANENLIKAYKKGHMIFTLFGKKLHGSWSLIRLKDEKNWLLIKNKDEYSRQIFEYDIISSLPDSVLSKRTLEQIKEKNAANWHAASSNMNVKDVSYAIKTSSMPIIKPMLCTLVDQPPIGSSWLHEIKLDGYRFICQIKNKKISFYTRNHHDWIDKFPKIKNELRKSKLNNITLDGELVALNEKGISNFQLLQNSIKNHQESKIIYYVFDLLYYQGYDLTNTPLIERKKLLQQILETDAKHVSMLRYSEHFHVTGKELFKTACQLGLEGIISKEASSVYSQTRSRNWLKIKCKHVQEFVVGGYTKPKGTRNAFGALLVGYYNKQGKLQYAGRVGTGFTEVSLHEIEKILSKLKQTKNPFLAKASFNSQGVQWVKPTLVIQIEYLAMTKDGLLRHASFQGVRSDKKSNEVIMEKTKSTKEIAKKHDQVKIEFTNLNKILYKDCGYTKENVVNYYEQVADYILPYIVNRPLTLLRCTTANKSSCFYQKHISGKLPANIYTIMIEEHEGQDEYIYIKNKAGLMSLIQLDTLEIHPWGCRIDKIERPDNIVFDLDPAPEVTWGSLIEAANIVREKLLIANLRSFIRTTGGKGLHVVVPIARRYEWSEVKNFAKAISETLEEMYPEKFTTTIRKDKRKNKIFIDYLRNGRGATAIASYSSRARATAPVAMPLAWEQIATVNPADFNIENTGNYLKNRAIDPWRDFLKLRQRLPKM